MGYSLVTSSLPLQTSAATTQTVNYLSIQNQGTQTDFIDIIKIPTSTQTTICEMIAKETTIDNEFIDKMYKSIGICTIDNLLTQKQFVNCESQTKWDEIDQITTHTLLNCSSTATTEQNVNSIRKGKEFKSIATWIDTDIIGPFVQANRNEMTNNMVNQSHFNANNNRSVFSNLSKQCTQLMFPNLMSGTLMALAAGTYFIHTF